MKTTTEITVSTTAIPDIAKTLKALGNARITDRRLPQGGCGYTIITVEQEG